MTHLRNALACVALVMLTVLLWNLNERVRQSEALLTDARRVILSLGGTATDIRSVADVVKKNSNAEAEQALKAAKQTNQDLADLHDLLLRSRRVVDDFSNTAVHLDTDLSAITAQSTASIHQIGDTLSKLEPVIASAQVSMDNLARVTGDPALLSTLRHLDATSGNVEHFSEDMAAMLRDDLRPAVHRATRPASKARIAFGLLSETFPLLARAIP